MTYTPIIGIEVHVELGTKSKMFCGCPADHFGKEPNTQTCPVCLGLPGALPVPNKKAIEWTIMIGSALNCRINKQSKFDRKHYFYPDLPKGYQISQYDQPLCEAGFLKTSEGRVEIERVHLEEDTGSLKHKSIEGRQVTLVDFNRSSVPLVEIVTKPVIFSSKAALAYTKELGRLVRFLGVSDADMEKGSMRLEANISLFPGEVDEIRMDNLPEYKVEIKNLNSFKFLGLAIEYEVGRQAQLLDKGIVPDQETRGWNEGSAKTVSQRSKEEAKDYRYFPDPDIPPLEFSDKDIEAITGQIPLLPWQARARLMDDYGVREDYTDILCAEPERAKFALELMEKGQQNQIEANVLAAHMVNKKVDIIQATVDEVLDQIMKHSSKPMASTEQLEVWCRQVIEENPDLVAKYKSGKVSVIGALIGQVMKVSKGEADAVKVQTLVNKLLT